MVNSVIGLIISNNNKGYGNLYETVLCLPYWLLAFLNRLDMHGVIISKVNEINGTF